MRLDTARGDRGWSMSDYLIKVGRESRLAVERHHDERGPVPTSRRAVRLRSLIAVAVVLLALAAAAVAATLVLRVGSPVVPPGNASPTVGIGIPAPGGSRLLAIRASDPAGGPPWGIRVLRTTRGLLCLQVGRIYQGRLGLLGVDGAFSDDRRLHPLPAGALGTTGPEGLIDAEGGILGLARSVELCAPAGATFTAFASGLAPSAEMVKSPGALPSSERRWISFGLLGAHAETVSYHSDERDASEAVRPPLGAYLVVLTGSAPGQPGGTDGSAFGQGQISTPRPQPTGAVTGITYRFGDRTCVDTNHPGTANSCPAPSAPARAIRRAIYTSRSRRGSFPTRAARTRWSRSSLRTRCRARSVATRSSSPPRATRGRSSPRSTVTPACRPTPEICLRTPAVRPRPSGCSTEPTPRRRR